MDSGFPHILQKELSCFICLNFMMDPVTISCGHSFCRPCVCLTWEEAQIPARCPICREPSRQEDFKTNIHLKNLVSIARQASLQQFFDSEEGMCGTHKKMKKIFCEENQSLLCVHCSDSPEHEAHRHRSISVAAEDYREELVKKMRLLWEKIQENKKNLNEESRIITQWMVNRSVRNLDIHQRAKKKFRTDCDWNIMFFPTVEISFDNEITNYVMLLGHVRRLMFGQDNQDTSPHSDDISDYFAAWGDQNFTSGKHYWELEVNDSWDWALGVCKDSSIRKKGTLIGSEDIFLLLCMKEDNHYRILTTSPMFPHYVEKPMSRVGVFLDFENGSVSFVNVAKSSFIWRYPAGSFNFPVRPLFFTGCA
uniref:Uncharacterized protein n=1 Tax=Oryctolagus cuniculus TaxID=9986 RepID=A0A5F9CPV1_RABIT